MQTAVMEFARNVCGMEGATSSEFDENAKYKVIDLMSDQVDVDKKGGTMRLGVYPCKVEAGTKLVKYMGKTLSMNVIVTVMNSITNTVNN